MPTFIMLVNWTDQGVRNLKDSPNRLDAFKQALQQAGGVLKGFYLLMGPYDMIAIVEAPDDQTLAKVGLASEAQGSIRSNVLRAYTEDEYRNIIGAISE
jgi:uncharacterized protein with GYD domain